MCRGWEYDVSVSSSLVCFYLRGKMYKVCQEINLNPPSEENEGFYSVPVRGIKRLSLFFIQGSIVLD